MGDRSLTRWYRAPFESIFSERAQFEALTLLVWAFFIVFLIAIVKRWEPTRDFGLAFLPVFHLLPWVVGLIEYRRLRKRTSFAPEGGRNLGEHGPNSLQSLIRVLWGHTQRYCSSKFFLRGVDNV
jgi:hypothetical protein